MHMVDPESICSILKVSKHKTNDHNEKKLGAYGN